MYNNLDDTKKSSIQIINELKDHYGAVVDKIYNRTHPSAPGEVKEIFIKQDSKDFRLIDSRRKVAIPPQNSSQRFYSEENKSTKDSTTFEVNSILDNIQELINIVEKEKNDLFVTKGEDEARELAEVARNREQESSETSLSERQALFDRNSKDM